MVVITAFFIAKLKKLIIYHYFRLMTKDYTTLYSLSCRYTNHKTIHS